MRGDKNSSIGVIGAGIQGVCIANFLIKKGFKVTLIDRDDPGMSFASASDDFVCGRARDGGWFIGDSCRESDRCIAAGADALADQ